MTTDIIDRPEDASKGGFQAIKRVEGILQPLKRVASRFESGWGNKPPSDQVEIVLEEAVILEMEEGEPMPELNEDRFTTWMTYAPPGKDKPSKNTFFVKGFCVAGIELAKARGKEDGTWRDLVNTRIVLEQREVFLFKRRKEAGSEEFDEFNQTNYVPVECGEEQDDINDYVRSKIVGLNPVAAKRAVLLDNRAKRYPEYKEAIDAGTICEKLGLMEDAEGIFREAEELAPGITMPKIPWEGRIKIPKKEE